MLHIAVKGGLESRNGTSAHGNGGDRCPPSGPAVGVAEECHELGGVVRGQRPDISQSPKAAYPNSSGIVTEGAHEPRHADAPGNPVQRFDGANTYGFVWVLGGWADEFCRLLAQTSEDRHRPSTNHPVGIGERSAQRLDRRRTARFQRQRIGETSRRGICVQIEGQGLKRTGVGAPGRQEGQQDGPDVAAVGNQPLGRNIRQQDRSVGNVAEGPAVISTLAHAIDFVQFFAYPTSAVTRLAWQARCRTSPLVSDQSCSRIFPWTIRSTGTCSWIE